MAQELEDQIRSVRSELTQLVRTGHDEDGVLLRRLLAQLERLEDQRRALRNLARGDAHVSLAI